MKIFTRFLFISFFFLVSANNSFSQCSGGGNSGFSSFNCTTAGTINPIDQGNYRQFTVISGISYNFNSGSTGYDTRISGNTTGVGGTNQFNQDSDNLSGNNESVDWTATFSGTLGVAVRYFSCTTWNGLSAMLSYKQNTTVNNTTSSASLCTGDSKSLTYTLGGAHNNPTPSWSIVSGGGSISGTTYLSGSYSGSVTVRATLGTCFDDVSFTVNAPSAAPSGITLTGGSNPTCGGNVTLQVSGGSLGSGAQWKWYSGSCGGTSAGTGSSIVVSPSSTTTYFVRAEGTCNTTGCGTSYTLTVNQNSTAPSSVTVGPPTTICNGSFVTLTQNGGVLGTGAVFNWYSSGCGSGFVGQGSSISVNPSSTTTYNVRAEGSCPATACATGTLTVNTTPAVNQPSNQAICIGEISTVVNFSGSGTSYTWSNNNTAIGLGASGTGSVPSFSGTNSTSNPITGTITVTPVFTQNSVSCPGPTKTFTITVNPSGTINQPSNQTVCNGNPTSTVTFSGNANGYSWTNDNTNINLASSGTGNINSFTATNSGTSPITANITVTPLYSGCPGPPKIFTITVNPTPSVNQPNSQTVCNGGSTTLVPFSGTGTSYTWTNSNAAIGLASSGTGDILSFTGTNSSSLPITGTIVVTPVYTNNSVSCSGPTKTITITVNPTPSVNQPSNQTLCHGSSTSLVSFGGTGTSYTWSNTNTNIGLGSGGTGNIPAFTATNPGANPISGTITVTPVYTNNSVVCNGPTKQFIITVNPLPVVSEESHVNLSCLNSSDGIITLSIPSTLGPYEYSIDNYSSHQPSRVFTGLAAGTYNTFKVQDANGCRNTNVISVTLTEPPLLEIQLLSTTDASCNGVFDGDLSVSASGGTLQYQYSLSGGPYQPGASFTNLAAGTYTVTVKDSKGCMASVGATINNSYVVTAAISNPVNISCPGGQDGAYTINGSGGVTPYNYANNTLLFGPGNTFTGLTAGTYTGFVRDSRGCLANDQVTLTANPAPTAIITGTSSFCAGGSTTLSASSSTPGSGTITTYQWRLNGGVVGTNSATYVATAAGNYTLTVTNSNICSTTSGTTSVTVNPLPTVTVNPFTAAICAGGSGIALTASGASTYTWSPATGLSGTSGTTVTANPGSTQTYTVNGTDANGCIGTTTKTVSVNSLPVVSVSPLTAPTICNGSSVQLTASGANSYTWSPATGLLSTTGATVTAQPTSTQTYTVTGTDLNGCSGTATKTVNVTNNPTVTITSNPNPATICLGQQITLTSSAANSYSWSTGATTQAITLTPAQSGTVTYTVFSTVSGCTGSASKAVTINQVPFAVINPQPTASICTGGNVTLSAVTDNGTGYLWSPGGATTSTISATSAGSYTVTISNGFNCSTTSSPTVVSVNSPPSVSITASPVSGSVCAGSTVTLTATGGMSSYAWSNGLVGQSITVSQSGTYTVTVTDANGCTNTATKVVSINALPTVSFSGLAANYCVSNGSGITLTGSPSGGTFSSTGGGLSGNTFTPSAAGVGTYTITYTYSTGGSPNCTNSSSQTVTVHALPAPTVTPQSATTFCAGGSVVLTTQSANSYLWSPGGATTQILNVTAGGNYSVTATNAFGCSATSAPVTVTVNPLPVPVITPNNPTTFCQGGSVTLSTTSYSSYSWLPGLQSTQSIVVSASGNYRVSVTDGNGCQGTSAVTTVTVNPNPVPTISGSTTFCTGDNTTLTASSASAYLWSPGGQTTQALTVGVTGTYSVLVTDANGCQGTASVTVSETPVNPVITALGSTTFCQGDSVTLFSSSSVGNTWSTGETTQFITVTTAGVVTLNVGQGNCTGTDNVTITVNLLPSVSFTGLDNSYCTDAPLVSLSGSPSGGTFSGDGISGNSFNPAAAGTGIHTIVYSYTDPNGCLNTDSQDVSVEDLPVVSFSGLASQYCANNPSVTLFGSPAQGTFTGTGISGNTFSPSVGAGTYTITYTYSDGNGCESSSSQTVTVIAAPVVSFSGLDPDYCSDEPSVTLTGSPAGGTFSGNGIIGSQFFPTVPGAGTHTITYSVTNANGCTAVSSQPVTIHSNPSVSFSGFNGPHAYCINASAVTLTGSPSGGTFTGPGITGNSFNPATAGAGTHTITYQYADIFGCGNTTTQNVTVNSLPVVTATAMGSTSVCIGNSVTIYSSAGTGNVWSPNGETTQFIFASQTGNYAVTVTDVNGCSATSAPVSVTINPLPTPVIAPAGPTTFCIGNSVTLNLTNSYTQYLWSNGATTSSITVSASGNYSVTVTNANGCTNTSSAVSVTVNPLPVATISPSGTVGICSGSTITLQGGGGVSYVWSPGGQTTQNLTTGAAGTYAVTVTNANGCTSVSPSTTVNVNNNPVPTVTALGPVTFCQGSSVTLVASAASNYLWSPNGETNQIISVTGSGSYVVTVTDGNGCVGTSTPPLVVTVNPLPAVLFSGLASQYCVDAPSASLTVSPSGGFFTGPVTGNTFNPALAGVGTHMVTYHFTNGNGCTNTFSQQVIVNPLPVVSFSGLDPEYCVDEPAVTLSGLPAGGTFTGTGISGLQFNPATAGPGTHTITYTYTDGNGCVNSSTQNVTVNPLPLVSFSGLSNDYCIDAPPSTLTGSPSGGTFTGTGLTGSVFDPADANLGTWTITYTYTDINGCTNSASHAATVHPLPVVTFGALANQYCVTETAVALSGNPSGGTFTGTGVTGSVFNPSVAGPGSHLITYTYTDVNGCTSSATGTAVVVPLPVVSFSGLNSSYCVNASAAALTGSPQGGSFSGFGISGNNFVPSQAGIGTHTVIYTYTDEFGCTNSSLQQVVVTPLPVISFSGLGADYCVNEIPATLLGNPSSGTFSGPGVSGNTFFPSLAGPGTHTITFAYTNGNGCTGTLSQNVVVYDLPVVTITPVTEEFCVTQTAVTLSATPSGGTFSGSGVNGSVFNPSAAGVGTHPVIYFYSDVNGCTNSDTIDIVVLMLPVVNFTGLDPQYCIDEAAVTLTGSPEGGTFSGNGITGDTFDPADAGIGTTSVTYYYIDPSGCANNSSHNVTVVPLPLVNISGLNTAYCVDAADVTLTGIPSGGTFSGPGISGTVFSPSDAGTGVHTISYNYTNTDGCSNAASQTVTVNELPVVTIDNSILLYCVSETAVSLVASPSGGVFSGTAVQGSTFNPSAAGTGTHLITYDYSDNNGCAGSATVSIEVVPLPVVSFTGLALQYCENGAPVTLTGSPEGGVFSGDGISGDDFDPSAAPIGATDITYTYTDGNGCSNTATNSVSVFSLPVVQFSGLMDDYCVDATAVELTPVPEGGAFLGQGIVNENYFSPASAGVGVHTITYAYINSVGCLGVTEQTTEVHALPVVSFTGLGSIYCVESDSVVMTGSPVGGFFSGPALNDSVFYPSHAGPGTHTITYSYYDVNGCFNSTSQTVTVYQVAEPSVTTNGPTSFCIGDDVTLFAQSGFVSYQWSNGSTTSAIAVDVESDISVTVTDANGCVATSDTLHITVNPLPVVNLGPDVSVCPGIPAVFDAGAGFDEYIWFPGGETSQSISTTVAGDYRASVTDDNGCFNYDEVTLTVFQVQVPVITSNGTSSICDGETLTLNAGVGYQSYDWSNNDTDAQTIVSQSGSYSVTVVDVNGCTSASAPFNVTVIPLPLVTILASGPPEICQGSSVTLSMPLGYSSYLWSNGSTTNAINVSQQDDYFGSATNSSGCSNFTPTVHITVHAQPQPVIAPQGPVTLCYGETIILDAGDQNYASYEWQRNLIPINIHSQYAPVGASGSYTVSVIDDNGCGQGIFSPAVQVTVLPELIPTITISATHDTLFSSSALSYQWYYNGIPVSGANQQFFVPHLSGNYRVAVTGDNNCTGMSAIIEYSGNIGIETADDVFTSIILFPNPGNGRFTLSAEFRSATDATIVISDVLGRDVIPGVALKDVSSFKREISLEEFANGVYLVRVITDEGQKVIRYIKE